jgi:hypothetical protein
MSDLRDGFLFEIFKRNFDLSSSISLKLYVLKLIFYKNFYLVVTNLSFIDIPRFPSNLSNLTQI